jgi:serpin B
MTDNADAGAPARPPGARARRNSPLGCFLSILLVPMTSICRADVDQAARATNEFGIDLYRKTAADGNLCLSPYSVESALAMTFAGAEGQTRSQMQRVLHLPGSNDAAHASFSALQHSLEQIATKTAKVGQDSGTQSEPITLSVANRLFAQTGYDFRESFRMLVQQHYHAAFELLDFKTDATGATQHINKWVAEQTHDRIRDLIPAGALNNLTRLVLTNAIYLKAPWTYPFSDSATKPQPFHVRGGAPVDVPMMNKRDRHFGYTHREGFTAVTLPYGGEELQFLIMLPDGANGLGGLESRLSAQMLGQCAHLEQREVDLSLPKFKFGPPTMALGTMLKSLGMKAAFDEPHGSANFDRIAPRKPDDYLYISEVFHKTFIAVDEKGTEAAAATAVTMMTATGIVKGPEPVEVKVDHPFIYAIQHVPTGACLFLGRVTDPR